MKTTVGRLKRLIKEVMNTSLSREQAIAWLARWASREYGFRKPEQATRFATEFVDQKRGETFQILKVPFVKDGVLLATQTEALDPYGDPAGWVSIESLFEEPSVPIVDD